MNIKLLLSFLIYPIVSMFGQQTSIEVSMGNQFQNQVYYKLNTEESTTVADIWDIAFLRTSNFEQAIRVNENAEITVFEASNSVDDWNTISVENENNWSKLYNGEERWNDGAFMHGSATYGWGEYDVTTHHIIGSVIFVLKYRNGMYKKLIIEDFFGGYRFRYATLSGNNWIDERVVELSNDNNINHDFNYYSLRNNVEVTTIPEEIDWDFIFTKYNRVENMHPSLEIGVLQNRRIVVAESTSTTTNIETLSFNNEMNSIGYDWKNYENGQYNINSDKVFYIKYPDNTIYRLVFESFSGADFGNIVFNYEDVTQVLNTDDIDEKITIGFYPNPIVNKRITVVYDGREFKRMKMYIYSVQGDILIEKKLSNLSKLKEHHIEMSSLESGMYLLVLETDKGNLTKKIILK